MAKPTKYDILIEGKKIIGAAQRKTKQGFLHQGTISLMMPCKELLENLLLPGTKVLEGMFTHTFPLLGQQGTKKDLLEARKLLREKIEEAFIQ
jgi:lipoate-protein ligase A